jgi:hypothetical protein
MIRAKWRKYPRARMALAMAALLLALVSAGCSQIAESTPLVAGAGGAVVLGVPDPPQVQNLTPAIEYFFDADYAWDIGEVVKGDTPPLKRFNQVAVNLGFVGVPVWMRFTLKNTTDKEQRYALEVTNPRIARVEFFSRDQKLGDYIMQASGAAVRMEERKVLHAAPAFRLAVAPGEEATFYLHVINSGSLRFSALLWRDDDFAQRMLFWRGGIFMIMGALAAMTVYHLIVYISLREVCYLYLALMTGLFLLYQAARTGIGPLMLWPNSPYWSTHSVVTLIMFVTAAATFFAESFLDTARKNPTLSIFLRFLGWCNIVSGLFGLTDLMFKYYLSHFIGVITAGVILAVVVQQLRMGSRPARVFIGGWGMMLLSAIVFALVGPGYLPSNLLTENFVEVGLLTAAVLCSLALADRIKVRDAEQRAALERAVEERTRELQDAITQVRTLSGLLPICSHCKKIRDDKGYWNSLEKYIYEHTDASLSHSICPECAQEHYPDIFGPNAKKRPT